MADASVTPAIVSANTNATVLAIAERAAALTTSPADRATPYASASSNVNGVQSREVATSPSPRVGTTT